MRSYAKYLGLPEEMVTRFRNGLSAQTQPNKSAIPGYNPRIAAGTVAYSPRWPSFAVLVIAALLLGASYLVMSAYTRAVNPTQIEDAGTIIFDDPFDDFEITEEIILHKAMTPFRRLDTAGAEQSYTGSSPDLRPIDALGCTCPYAC